MKNYNWEAIGRFEQAKSAEISKLFWIASCWESHDLKDMLSYMDPAEFEKCFPEVKSLDYYQTGDNQNEKQVMELLWTMQKAGFIAEVLIPKCRDFSYDDNGKPKSWSSSRGYCTGGFVYAETPAGLIKEVSRIAAEHFQLFIKDDKKKKQEA